MQTVHAQLKLMAGLLLFLGVFFGVTSNGFATDLVATFREFPDNLAQLTQRSGEGQLAQVVASSNSINPLDTSGANILVLRPRFPGFLPEDFRNLSEMEELLREVKDFFAENSYGKYEIDYYNAPPYQFAEGIGRGDFVNFSLWMQEYYCELTQNPTFDISEYDFALFLFEVDRSAFQHQLEQVSEFRNEAIAAGELPFGYAHPMLESFTYTDCSDGEEIVKTHSWREAVAVRKKLSGTLGGSPTGVGLFFHELGHGLWALGHSFRGGDAYGNDWDVMGNGSANIHFNVFSKIIRGWLEDEDILRINAPGTYRIRAQQSKLSNIPRAARINFANNFLSDKIFEFRQPIGFDFFTQHIPSDQYGLLLLSGENNSPIFSLADSRLHPINFLESDALTEGNCYINENIRIRVPQDAIDNEGTESATLTFHVDVADSEGLFEDDFFCEGNVEFRDFEVQGPSQFKVGDSITLRFTAVNNGNKVSDFEAYGDILDIHRRSYARYKFSGQLNPFEQRTYAIERTEEGESIILQEVGLSKATLHAGPVRDGETFYDRKISSEFYVSLAPEQPLPPRPEQHVLRVDFTGTGNAHIETWDQYGSDGAPAIQCSKSTYPKGCLTRLVERGPGTTHDPLLNFVELVAFPEEGSEFSEWGGVCEGDSSNICTFSMDGPKVAIAEVNKKPQLALTVDSENADDVVRATVTWPTGGGHVVYEGAQPFTERYPNGTVVDLHAFPNETSTFTGWEGVDCKHSSEPEHCQIWLNHTQEFNNVTATFETLATHNLNISITGEGTGEVTGVYELPNGTEGPITCTEGPCSITKTNGGALPEGTLIALNAVPGEGNGFVQWSANTSAPTTIGCTTETNCDFVLQEDTEVGAEFETVSENFQLLKNQNGRATISYEVEDNGNSLACIVGETACTIDIPFDAKVTIAYENVGDDEDARPDNKRRHVLDHWEGACSGSSLTCTFTMSEETTSAEAITHGEYHIEVGRVGTKAEQGKITGGYGIDCGSVCETWVEQGKSITLSASVTQDDVVFSRWQHDCEHANTNSTCTILDIQSSRFIHARFNSAPTATLQITKNGNGNGTIRRIVGDSNVVCSGSCGATFPQGVSAQVIAQPNSDSTGVVSWCGGTSCTRTLAGTTGDAVTVTFTKKSDPWRFNMKTVLHGNGRFDFTSPEYGTTICSYLENCGGIQANQISSFNIRHVFSPPTAVYCKVTDGSGDCTYTGNSGGSNTWRISRTVKAIQMDIFYPGGRSSRDVVEGDFRDGSNDEGNDVVDQIELETVPESESINEQSRQQGEQRMFQEDEELLSNSDSSAFANTISSVSNFFSRFTLPSGNRGLAQVGGGGVDLVGRELVYAPNSILPEDEVVFTGLVSNESNIDVATPIAVELFVDQQVGASWNSVHESIYYLERINKQTMEPTRFGNIWIPEEAGKYRAQMCVRPINPISETRTDNNCTYYEEFEAFNELPPNTHTLRTGPSAGSLDASGKVTADIDALDGPVFCTTQCEKEFWKGSIVTLRAIANLGYQFVGWKGPGAQFCRDTERADECHLQLTEDRNVHAEFIAVEQLPYGDVNEDGRVTVSDALATLQYAVRGSLEGTAFNPTLADVDCNGSEENPLVTAADALFILKVAVGQESAPQQCPVAGASLGVPDLSVAQKGEGSLLVTDLQQTRKGDFKIKLQATPKTKRDDITWNSEDISCRGKNCTITTKGNSIQHLTVIFGDGKTTPTNTDPGNNPTQPTPGGSDLLIRSADDLRLSAGRKNVSFRAKLYNGGAETYEAPLRFTIQIDDDISETHELRNGKTQRIGDDRTKNVSIKTNWAPTVGQHTYTFCVLPLTDADSSNNCASGTFEIDQRGRLVGSGGMAVALGALGVLVTLSAALRIRQRIAEVV